MIVQKVKPKEAVYNVMCFMMVNKHFYETINSRENMDKIINHIADEQRCSHETIERYLNTPYAKERLQIKRKLKRLCCSRHNTMIMTEKSLKPFFQQDIESTHNHKGVQKTTLMMLLSQPELWPLFFAKGADINTPNAHGITLLMFATEYPRWSDVVDAILTHPNIKINQQNKKGESALMYALKRKHMAYITPEYVSMIIKLLKAGADPELPDKSGRTPHLAACLLADVRIVQLIESAILIKKDLF